MKPGNEQRDYSARELAEAATTTVRTVHYYTAEGLLPPPNGTTRGASYGPAHLARLRLIAALRSEGMALGAIRARLAPLTDAQVLQVAATLDQHQHGADERTLSTVALIDAAVADQLTRPDAVAEKVPDDSSATMLYSPFSIAAPQQLSEDRDDLAARVDSPGDVSGLAKESAREYLDRVLRRGTEATPRPMLPPARRPTPVRPPARTPRPSLSRVSPEAWYHVTIVEGIELRVREDRYHEAKGRLNAVTDTLRTALQRYGLTPPHANDSEDDADS